jgi:hypothetical protein
MKKKIVLLISILAVFIGTLHAAVEKGPYLIYEGNNTQMTVLWQMNSTQSCTINWGLDTSYSTGTANTSQYGSDNQHKYVISDLSPGTKYFYEVVDVGTGSFRTAPAAAAENVKILAYGDTRTNPGNHNLVNQEMINTYIIDSAYQTITLHTADWVNADSENNWTSEFFGLSQAYTREFQANMPINGCKGNHEGSGVSFNKYFPYPYVSGFYWSFDYGPVHVVVLDQYTTYSSGSAQYIWLENDLDTTDKEWKIIVLHSPAWSAAGGGHGNNGTTQTHIQPLCVTYGVDLVLAGHNHYYARCLVDGINHITVGGGGAPLKEPSQTEPYLVLAESTLNFAEINIQGEVMYFIARRDDGTVIENFYLSHVPLFGFTSDPILKVYAIEGTAYSNTIADDAEDPESDPLTFSKDSGPTWLSVASNGDLSGTPGAGDVGMNEFTVHVTDGIDSDDTAALKIEVIGENSVTYTQNAAAPSTDVIASFTNTNTIWNNITVAVNDGVGTENMYGETFSYTEDFAITAISFHATGDTKSYGSGQMLELSILKDTNSDGVPDQIAGVVDPVEVASITGSTPWKTFTFSTPVNCVGNTTYAFVYTLIGPISNNMRVATNSDGSLYTAGKAISANYTAGAFPDLPIGLNANRDIGFVVQGTTLSGSQPPTFTIDPINEIAATEDAAYSSTIADDASDPESDPMSFSKFSGPTWLSVASNGALSGTPTNSDVGANAFTVQVTAAGGSDTATLNITVINTNDAPTFTVDPINKPDATEDAAYSDSIAGSATDEDAGDTLTYSKTAGSAWLSVAADGTLSGTPGAGDVGVNVFTVQVDDGNGGTDTATLNITVNGVCISSTTHVDAIVPDIQSGSRGRKYGYVTVTVLDNCGNVIANADVTGTFTGDYDETLVASTDAAGVAVFTTTTQIKKPSYTFCVDGISHATLTYDSNDDVETCDVY